MGRRGAQPGSGWPVAWMSAGGNPPLMSGELGGRGVYQVGCGPLVDWGINLVSHKCFRRAYVT